MGYKMDMGRLILTGLLLVLLAGCQRSTVPGAARARAEDRPEMALAHLMEGTRLLERGQHDRAEQHLRQALEIDPFLGLAHNNLGKVYFHQGRMYEAAWHFDYAIKLLPYHPEPRANLGLVFEVTGKLREAIAAYVHARELQPENPHLIGNLARARVRRGDRDEQTRDLLQELILKDTRPRWREWAERELMLFPQSDH
jgi:Tfp pilus assembly protein PilF